MINIVKIVLLSPPFDLNGFVNRGVVVKFKKLVDTVKFKLVDKVKFPPE